MTLRTKFTIYLIALHIVLAVAACVLLIQERVLLFVVEGLFLLLLFRGEPFFAEAIDHPVVDADQRVHLRLADGDEARGKIALVDQLRARVNQIERHEQAAHE